MDPKQQAILDWIHAKSDAQATDAIIALASLPPETIVYPEDEAASWQE